MTDLRRLRAATCAALPAANRFLVLTATSGAAAAIATAITPVLSNLLHSARKAMRMHSLRRLLVSLSFVLLLGGSATAETSPTGLDAELDALLVSGGLTADQAAARARATAPAVARKRAELDAAIANAEAASLARIPTLSTKLSYTRLSSIDAAELAPGVELPVLLDSYGAQGQLVVPLSDYVLRFPKTIGAARSAARASSVGKRSTELGAAAEARIAYYEWVRARLQLLVTQRQVTQVRATLGQIRDLAANGRVNRADVLRLEAQEAEAEQLLDRARTLADLREEVLRLHIGAAASEHLTIGEDIRASLTVPATTEVPLETAMSKATRQRLDLKAIDLAIEANEQRRDAERANQLPRLTAIAAAEYTNPNQRVFPQRDELSFTWSAGAQLTFTLNDALISRANSRRLAADTQALRADRESTTRSARIQVMTAQQGVHTARESLITSRTRLVAAEESYRVRRELIAAERGTAVELVDAETELTRARIAMLDAHVDLRIALAELDHAVGDDLTK